MFSNKNAILVFAFYSKHPNILRTERQMGATKYIISMFRSATH